jgi:hypothetical protein
MENRSEVWELFYPNDPKRNIKFQTKGKSGKYDYWSKYKWMLTETQITIF